MSTPTVVAGGPLPSLVRRGPAPYAGGYGLFTTRAVKAGEVVLHLTDPLVVVPDDKHLGECCSGCMLWRPPPPLAQKQEQEQEPRYPDPEVEGLDQDLKLVRCAWCTVVWYCGKDCQKRDWKRGHKHECSIYKALLQQQGGRVLSVSVRVLVRLLLLRKHGAPPTQNQDRWWKEILDLQGHESAQAQVKERAEMVPVMAKAGQAYSGSPETEGMCIAVYCRTLVNSFSITTTTTTTSSSSSSTTTTSITTAPQKNPAGPRPPPTPTPTPTSIEEVIGNFFDPRAAQFNHSCEPNCVMEFVGREMVTYTVRDLEDGEEATVSYVDVDGVDGVDGAAQRARQLREQWFFDCACGRCRREQQQQQQQQHQQ